MTNRTSLNFSRVNCAPINGAQLQTKKGGGVSPFPEGLIARYACYDKTNEDEDREILKDLSGNGHDIQLYNFAFSGSSGYGDYPNMEATTGSIIIEKSKKNIGLYTLLNIQAGHGIVNYSYSKNAVNWKVNISNIPEGVSCVFSFRGVKQILNEGLNVINAIGSEEAVNKNPIISFNKTIAESEMEPIIIQFEAGCKGALVSDGVDDYGLCENFPILNRDRGYTVCTIRKILSPKDNKSWALLSDTIITSANEGNIIFERQGSTGRGVTSFKGTTNVDFVEKHFSYMTSISYNGFNLSKGASLNTNDSISLFRYSPINDGNYVSSALYSLEIYDHDLTDEEITKVKTRMIAEYEETTGEKYTEETT